MGRRKEEISKPYKLYKTTNLINNRYYIGIHKTWSNSNFGTENSTDKYLGSGVMILKAIEKYGRENFKIEILEEFDLEEDAYNRENEIITWEWLKENHDIVYNVIPGGGSPPLQTSEGGKKAYQTMLTNGTFSKPPVHIGANNCMTNSEFVALYRSGENHHHAKDPTIRIRVKESNIKTHNTKEIKEKISKIQKETHNTEKYKNLKEYCNKCNKLCHITVLNLHHNSNCKWKNEEERIKYETRKKTIIMSDSGKKEGVLKRSSIPKLICNICGKEGAAASSFRHNHFKNCKYGIR